MFAIFYDKTSLVVLGFRHDISTNPMSAVQAFDDYLSGNKLSEVDMSHAELEYQKLDFQDNKYLYNPTTNKVDENPNYVEPVPTPEPVEPTA